MKTNDVFNFDMIDDLDSGHIFTLPEYQWDLIVLQVFTEESNDKELWGYSWNDGSGKILGDKDDIARYLENGRAIFKGMCHNFRVC